MTFTKPKALLAAAMVAFVLPQPALAQEEPQAQAPAVSEAQLRSFAAAVVDLQRIERDVQPRLQAAAPEEQQSIRQEAQARMVEVVQSHDLDPSTFNQIAAAAEQDPQLAQRIGEYVREASPGR